MMEYATSEFYGAALVREDHSQHRPDALPRELELEVEIDRLRARMVELCMSADSLTSDLVIQISRELDEKINEYMDLMKRDR